MDVYRNKEIGDVIVGEPFCKALCVKARRFQGFITIHNGNDNVSARDKLNEISHPYQLLKSFYKGTLNLGPKYVQDENMEEWLTRRHVSIHEMEGRAKDKSNLKTLLQLNMAYRSSDITTETDPEREFRSSRKLFKTPSLDESSSPEFDLFSNLEEHFEEEIAEAMGGNHGRIHVQDPSGSDHEDANEHIEKVLEIVDLFHIPKITQDQIMLRALPMSLTGAASRWLRNEPSGSIITWEAVKKQFLSKYCPPSRTAKKMEEINKF
ncbi:hypothetical protein Tco_0266270 [Tanacetum coccineum]